MKTFDDIVKEVLRYGFDDGPQVNKARIEAWVNEGQVQVARHVSAPEFQANAEQTLTVGTYKYTEPSGLLMYLSILYPAAESRLVPVDLQTFDTYSAEELQSIPLVYTVFGTELWLWPTPSAADKLQIRYIKKPPELKEAADVPVLPKDYLHLLVDYALMRAYRAEDDLEAAAQHQAQYEKDLKQYELNVLRIQDDRPMQLQGTWGR